MKTLALAGLAIAGLFVIASPASAGTWSRHTTVTRTGPHDVGSTRTYTGANGRTYTRNASTNCADGSCTRNATVTGPNGRSVNRSETVTRTGRGDFTSSGSVTGPNGRTVTQSGQIDCGRFACARSGTVTGPNGGTASTAGWWWR